MTCDESGMSIFDKQDLETFTLVSKQDWKWYPHVDFSDFKVGDFSPVLLIGVQAMSSLTKTINHKLKQTMMTGLYYCILWKILF